MLDRLSAIARGKPKEDPIHPVVSALEETSVSTKDTLIGKTPTGEYTAEEMEEYLATQDALKKKDKEIDMLLKFMAANKKGMTAKQNKKLRMECFNEWLKILQELIQCNEEKRELIQYMNEKFIPRGQYFLKLQDGKELYAIKNGFVYEHHVVDYVSVNGPKDGMKSEVCTIPSAIPEVGSVVKVFLWKRKYYEGDPDYKEKQVCEMRVERVTKMSVPAYEVEGFDDPVCLPDVSLGQVVESEDNDQCQFCGDVGLLLLCDKAGCERAFHPGCVGLAAVPEGDWFCPTCSGAGGSV